MSCIVPLVYCLKPRNKPLVCHVSEPVPSSMCHDIVALLFDFSINRKKVCS